MVFNNYTIVCGKVRKAQKSLRSILQRREALDRGAEQIFTLGTTGTTSGMRAKTRTYNSMWRSKRKHRRRRQMGARTSIDSCIASIAREIVRINRRRLNININLALAAAFLCGPWGNCLVCQSTHVPHHS